MTQLLPPKKEVALALLERSNVDVYLDPRAKGVVVPPQFRKEPRLILKIGLNMPVPIPDLRLDDDSMSCTLSFNRSPFYCVVPWTSVFAMVGEDGRGMVWPDDVPQELAVKVVEPSEQDPRARADEGARPTADAGAASSSSSSRRGESSRRVPNRDRGAPAQAQARGEDAADRAVSSSSSSSRGGAAAGGKRKKKKEEGQRPVLVAVPPVSVVPPVPPVPPGEPATRQQQPRAEADVRSEASGSDRPREIRQPPESRRPAAPRDGVSAVPSSRPSAPPSARPSKAPPQPGPGIEGPVRPKRELPPYLRVVK